MLRWLQGFSWCPQNNRYPCKKYQKLIYWGITSFFFWSGIPQLQMNYLWFLTDLVRILRFFYKAIVFGFLNFLVQIQGGFSKAIFYVFEKFWFWGTYLGEEMFRWRKKSLERWPKPSKFFGGKTLFFKIVLLRLIYFRHQPLNDLDNQKRN